MMLNKYAVTLKHDDGVVRVTTTASNEETAVRLVLESELAPLSALIRVELLGRLW